MWFYCSLIIVIATASKLGGSMLASTLSGISLKEAAGLGTLMNTRGLMELVVLNIGLDIKVISPALFSMMVIMALVTTSMTTPVLGMIYPTRLMLKPTTKPAEEQVAVA
jgi:Kef-type K+ transport system membrane component KefB